MRELTRQLKSHISKFSVDVVNILSSKERLRQLFRIPIYSNALYLMVATAANALLGFAFWIIVARFYSIEDVGLASAIIAAMGLLAAFSQLGLGMGLIRFLPHSSRNANSMINTVFSIGILTSIAAALIFIAGLGFWSPALLFIKHNPIYLAAFGLFTIASTLFTLTGQTFVAERRAGFTLANNLIFSLLKLPLLILLAAFFHTFGIFASWGISLVVALLLSAFLFLPRVQADYRPRFAISWGVTNEIMHFSFANYLAGLLWGAPVLLLPIIVVNLLGAEPNAYFYIAWTTSSVLAMIPAAVSTSLFAEGSHDEERLGLNIWRSLKMVFLILAPAIILIVVFADKLLLLFGSSYAENATTLLRIFAIAALPLAVNSIYLAVKRVEKKLRIIVGLSAFAGAVTIGLVYVLLPRMGINGAGIAWLTAQVIVALVIAISFFLKRVAVRGNRRRLGISQTKRAGCGSL